MKRSVPSGVSIDDWPKAANYQEKALHSFTAQCLSLVIHDQLNGLGNMYSFRGVFMKCNENGLGGKKNKKLK